MLERVYNRLDLQPQVYPFLNYGRRGKVSHADWTSGTQGAFKREYTRGPSPRLPEVQPAEKHRAHVPHSRKAYHIRRIYNQKVCEVQTSLPDRCDSPVLHSVTAVHFPRMPASHYKRPQRRPTPLAATHIVPMSTIETFETQQMLPPSQTEDGPRPRIRYASRKRILQPHVPGEGVIYRDQTMQHPYCTLHDKSISSLTGSHFTRRRESRPTAGTLAVKGFDGGAPALPRRIDVLDAYRS